jgi:hypothetical protein
MAALSDTSHEYLDKKHQLMHYSRPTFHNGLPLSGTACLFPMFVQRLYLVLKASKSYDINLGAVCHKTLPSMSHVVERIEGIKYAFEIM